MRKKYLSALLFGALLVTSAGTFTSCKDYDDDIKNLQEQVDGIKTSLEELQTLVKAGTVITKVETITDGNGGIKITTSDGKTYDVLNGANGTAGKDADVWTIGSDGYWYKNDNKTEYKAVGANGTNGTNGKYYVPNTETGYFDIYQDGKLVESTEISWKAAGVTAIKNGNTLTFANVEGVEGGKVEIKLGEALGSVAFLPERISQTLPYPTTTKDFYHIGDYIDETKYTTDKTFIGQAYDKSNVVEMLYRLNPNDTYVGEDTYVSFVNRAVSRATGDLASLMEVRDSEIKNGEATVKALVNASKLTDKSLAALQVVSGQESVVTSDFVHITSKAVDVVIADTTVTKVGNDAIKFYPRKKAIVGDKGETSEFIKEFVALTADENFDLVYNDANGLDLKDKVGLYSDCEDKYLVDLGFYGMEYEFSLPKEYLADDQQKTNQQWFVTLNDGVLKVNREHFKNENKEVDPTPAIGRTPVVRVDAFMVDNHGVRRMVASSYIKVAITRTADVDKEAIKAEISGVKEKDYYTLNTAYDTQVGVMSWQDVNTKIYGKTGLTATSFWKFYGGEDDTYDVKIEAEGAINPIYTKTGVVNGTGATFKGIEYKVDLNADYQTTSNVELSINNKIETENTYTDVKGKGAKYTVTITIKSDDKKAYPDVILTQEFYVKEDCKTYEYNPLYYVNSYDGKAGDYIVVKGQLNENDKWEMSTAVVEHFKKDAQGDNIFDGSDYLPVNVNSIEFNWAVGETGVTAPVGGITANDNTVALSSELTEPYARKKMTYTTTLANGEKCDDYSYNIVFVNPFIAGNAEGVELTDGAGPRTVETADKVLVLDTENAYIWKDKALTSKATSVYKVAEPTITYAFVENNDYNTIMNNKSDGSVLEVNPKSGKVTWKNEGSLLQSNYNLEVEATVKFEKLSVVKVRIPVTLKKQ